MKHFYKILLLIVLLGFVDNVAIGQSYQAQNKIAAVVRDVKTKQLKLYLSHNLSVKSDLE